MLGFAESFVANFFCRFCKMHKKDCRESCFEKLSLIRNVNNYENDLLIDNLSLTGIKERSIFNEISNYHVVNNLTVDIMHDLAEGVCKSELSKLLQHCILKKKYFTLQTLTWRIKFHFFHPYENCYSGITDTD